MCFVDWIKVHQIHSYCETLPFVQEGFILNVDDKGDLIYQVARSKAFEGSYSGKIFISCDGEKVTLSGNVGKFHRKDNVFNYRLDDIMTLCNRILASIGLPPFTTGERIYIPYKNKNGETVDRVEWTGARITRLDITRNFATGSPQNLTDFHYYMSTQKPTRQTVRVYKDADSIVIGGDGSRRFSCTLYKKSQELKKHYDQDDKYIRQLTDYLYQNGVTRMEMRLQSTQLTESGLAYWGEFTHDNLDNFYDKYESQIIKEIEIMDIDDLPKTFRATYYDYINGVDVKNRLSASTFYRHRSEILKTGTDIAVAHNIVHFKKPIKVIKLEPLPMPDWYQLPKVI